MSAAIHTSRTVPVTVPRIARSLYSILFLCVSMFLLVLPATFLYFRIGGATERKRRRLHRFICRASRFIVRRVPGTCFTLDNSVGERFDKPAVIISNHQSHLDLMCILMLTPNLVVLTNDWVHRNPIYGLVIRYAEFYAVSDGIEANLGRLADLVRRGYSIVVFPEGTRSPDCRIGRFHRGAFYLAEQLHLDLLPIYLHGVGHVLPKRDFMLRRGSMHAEVGRRITPDDSRYGADYKARTYQRAGGVVDPVPDDAPFFVKDYHDYYKTPRGYHPRSLNSTDGWNVTSPLPLLNAKLLAYANEIRSAVLVIHGDKAHSCYFSRDAFARLQGGNKELLLIPGAVHTDLYDRMDIIPFDRIEAFYRQYLK